MLVDIFARRYGSVPLRNTFEQRDSRLLVQAFRILAEDIYPYYRNGKEDNRGVSFWTNLHSRLSRELGLQELSRQWFSYTTKWNGNDVSQTHKYAMVKVCENWLTQPVVGSPDEFIKERLSLIELGFREREGEVGAMNAQPIERPVRRPPPSVAGAPYSMPVPDDGGARIRQMRAEATALFRSQVEELNARFRQASYDLHYHNGFIQASTDGLVQQVVETPFWSLVSGPKWVNVDHDMKEALDLRDSDGRDPSFYAARALESTIKIISGAKGWSHGGEKGAHNYIDNLAAKRNALITPWEAAALKDFFTHVRNPFGHGPGSEAMPKLTRQQTEWAIELCMSWIKNLIRRA
jgi:hypothetical protein